MNSVACRLPSVIVPVLSSSSVSTSPAASTARPDIASTLCCIRRSMPAMPIADSSPPMVVGIRQTSSDTSTKIDLRRAGVDRERLQRHDREQKDDRQAGEQDVQRDLVRRLLPLGAFDQRDHAIEERLAGFGRDAHLDPVREHARAAGDRRTVAAGLADDRRRLAGDRRLVDRGDAFDDLAVAGNELAGADTITTSSLRRLRRRHRLRSSPPATQPVGRRSRSAPCAACRPAPCRAPRPSPRRSWRTAP